MVIFFAAPLLAEIDYVLKLWLKTPPADTDFFCVLFLLMFLIERMSLGYLPAANAHGRIAGFHTFSSLSLISTLPLAWILLKLGYPPISVGFASVTTMILCSVSRALWAQRMFGLPFKGWLKNIVFPCFFVFGSALIACFIPKYLMPESFLRLAAVTFSGIFVTGVLTWFFAFDDPERSFFRNYFSQALLKAGLTRKKKGNTGKKTI
jgi:hypothetical protein